MRIPILTYHSIDNSGSVISTSPRNFRRQMRALKDGGFEVVPLSDAITKLLDGTKLPEKTLVLTFDDGFRNFYTVAAPVLLEFGFGATVFLVTGHCGWYNDWFGNPTRLPRSELLTWSEVRELSDQGFEFGSHTRTHADLTKLSANETEFEIKGSKDALSNAIGREVTTFAYPFGRSNEVSRRLARENYIASCSTDLGKVTYGSDCASLERIDAYYLGATGLVEMLDTPAFDSYMRLRQSLRSAKARLFH